MRNIIVEEAKSFIGKQEVEVVERKGLGHPDTLSDGIAEEVSRALCRYYLQKFGVVLHHNVDKITISGGRTKPDFGGGKVLRPISVLLSGQATDKTEKGKIPVARIAKEAAKKYLKKILPFLNVGRDVVFDSKINMGSADLRDVFARKGVPAANDTSLGVGFAPMTELEKMVLNVEGFLNSPDYKKMRPAVGQDIKIMGARVGGKIFLTVAAAIICRFIENKEQYIGLKGEIEDDILKMAGQHTDGEVEVFLNTADKPEKGAAGCYLTVTGTSAEMGDSGAVGRGNRVNGLITPGRPMCMEAASGKNPVNHVGKIYNILAFRAANAIYNEVPGLEDVQVKILSQIGKPIDQPLVASVIVKCDDLNKVKSKIAGIMDEKLSHVTDITDELLKHEVGTF